MNILCVDDERKAVELLKELCKEIDCNNEIYGFTNPEEGLELAKNTPIDIALLDVDMPGMSGIELAQKLKAFLPTLNIIMVTAYSQYSVDAFQLDASGYLTKPISLEKLSHQFDVLRFPVKSNLAYRVKINTDGGFQILIDDCMPHFKYSKTVNLLEYLVKQNGRLCSNSELELALWNDGEDHYEYLKSLKKDLHSVLTQAGAENIILSGQGRLAFNKTVFRNL